VHRVSGDEHRRFCDGMEDHIEKHKDDEEDDGQDHLQTLLGPQFEFIFSRPFVGATRRQMQLLLEHVICGFCEVTVISGIEINVESVLRLHHGSWRARVKTKCAPLPRWGFARRRGCRSGLSATRRRRRGNLGCSGR
jgi:hypothetical protein